MLESCISILYKIKTCIIHIITHMSSYLYILYHTYDHLTPQLLLLLGNKGGPHWLSWSNCLSTTFWVLKEKFLLPLAIKGSQHLGAKECFSLKQFGGFPFTHSSPSPNPNGRWWTGWMDGPGRPKKVLFSKKRSAPFFTLDGVQNGRKFPPFGRKFPPFGRV